MVKSVCRSKAVSDGAVIWHATSLVIPHGCPFSYGNIVHRVYDPKNAKHKERPIFKDIDGEDIVDNVWYPIIKRVS